MQLQPRTLCPTCDVSSQTQVLETDAIQNLQSTFVRNVSHELRTPLSIILGYAELLHEGDLGALTPEQHKASCMITNNAQKLKQLVDRINVLLTTQSHATVSSPLCLAELAAKVLENPMCVSSQSGASLDVYLEPDLPLVAGDVYQLEQAIDCLIDNAFKFTPDGGRVTVRTYLEPGWVCLEIADTGIGISEQEIERIFTSFYQIDGSTTRHYGGLGLGLAVVKAVVEEHAGQIEVESQPGQGSRFILRLPALSPQATGDTSIQIETSDCFTSIPRETSLETTSQDKQAHTHQEHIELMLIQVGREVYGVETDYIRDIRPANGIHSPGWIEGVGSLDGQALLVIDPQQLLGPSPRPETCSNQLVAVIKTPGMEAALLIDDMLSVEALPTDYVQRKNHHNRRICPNYVQGVVAGAHRHTGNLVILDLPALLADKRLTIH